MPCDSVQLNQVEVSKMDPPLLVATEADLSKAGILVTRSREITYYSDGNYQYVLRDGQLSSRAPVEALTAFRNKLAQAYSKTAVYAAAKRNGWRVRQTGPNQYEVQR